MRGAVPYVLPLLAPLLAAGCGSITSGSGGGRCNVQQGLEMCLERSAYAPGGTIVVRIRNVGSVTRFLDGCSNGPVGVTDLQNPFPARYTPTVHCGPGASAAEIVAAMTELAPGETVERSHTLVVFAFQGFYRVNFWLLDETGSLLPDNPVVTRTFDVFPSA